MSFFLKKQSKDGKIRMENQLTDARMNPSPTIDVSNCDLAYLPDGFFALCKVLRKEVILCHDNRLQSLNEKNNKVGMREITDTVRVIDAHSNKLERIPIAKFTSLQVLILENNRLSVLPDELFHLTSLQTLNLRNNNLTLLPDLFYGLKSLRFLDISSNKITHIPLSAAKLKSLETCVLDAKQMVYPDASICEEGTVSIMKYLCSQSGQEYTSPSCSVLPLLNSPAENVARERARTNFRSSDVLMLDSFSKQAAVYQRKKEEKMQEQARIQQTLLEAQSKQASLVANCVKTREQLIRKITMDQSEIDLRVQNASNQKEQERLRLLAAITQIENESQNLVSDILALNKQVKWAEKQLEEEENRKLKENEFFKIRYEEYEKIRKGDIEKTMAEIMSQNMSLEQLRLAYENNQNNAANRILQLEQDHYDTVDSVLKKRDKEVSHLLQQLLQDEQFQKEALLSLMISRDARSNRLNSQIDLIQTQLAQLSQVEMKNRDLKVENEQMCLEDERVKLTRLLLQLNEEKEYRNRELQRRLVEMEQANEESFMDFWLVQFQRMLESKPEGLIRREHELDMDIEKILIKSGAENYIPSFARHQIAVENLPFLKEEDLQRLGIYQVGLRKSVLETIEEYLSSKKVGGGDGKGGKGGKGLEEQPPLPPSAPSTSRMDDVTNAVYEVECVVCMENKCEIVLIPCGHVCMCVACSTKINTCPMCRQQTTLKMKLTEHINIQQ